MISMSATIGLEFDAARGRIPGTGRPEARRDDGSPVLHGFLELLELLRKNTQC
jgi:hypothetical protein